MRKFIDNNFKKIIIISIVIVILLLCTLVYLVAKSNTKTKTFENDTMTFKYDTNWNLYKSDVENVSLKHSKLSEFSIQIKILEDSKKYESLDSLINDIEYSITNENNTYSLIEKEKTTITNKNLNAYKILYEKENKQVLVIVTKIEDKIIVFTYLSNSNYYDVLLDSAYSIVHSFEVKKEQIILNTKVEEDTITNISWSGDIKVNNTKEYFISKNQYLVNYKLPSQFILSSFDSEYGYFTYRDDNKSYSISTAIKLYNIYEWKTLDKAGLIQSEINYIKKNNLDVKVEISKNELYKGSYIYRITYNYEDNFSNEKIPCESVYIVYPLDYMKVFEIKIESRRSGVSSEMIKNINITKKEKIAAYIYRNIENGYLVNEMKKFYSYDKDYYEVKLLTPEEWKEKNTYLNVFETRKFGLNCNESDGDTCEYNLAYFLGNGYSKAGEEIIKSIRDDYTDSKAVYNGVVKYNGKSYESYSLEYEKKVYGEKTTKRKFYETIIYEKLDNGYVFVVKLNRIDKKLDTPKISTVLNYSITDKNYN